MPNVDPGDKSQKTLKTEELEVLVRLLNSNLESLRYLQRESSIRDDVALNNRLLTARISALSGLITFMSEGELTQIRASSVSMHDTANSTTRPRETTNPLGRTVRNLSLPVDDDEEGQADDESEYDDDDDDESDEEAEGEEGEETAYPQPKETHSNIPSKPRPPIFQNIRPLMEVLRTGIQDIPPTTLHTNFKSSKPPLDHRPRNNHTNCSVTTTTITKWRSEYEMGDISSIDGKRRPVAGIPAPIRWVPRGRVLKGGEEPRRGNLIDLKKTRRPRFLPQISRTRMAGTPTADVPVPSSVNDVRYIPRKRPLHDDDGDSEELVDKKRQRVFRGSSSDPSMEPGPSTARPTIPPRKTTSNWKVMPAKLFAEGNKNRNTTLHPSSTSSSSSSNTALSTASMSSCLVPASSSNLNDALILNPLPPTPVQIHEEPEKDMSNSSLPFASPPSLDMPSSASDSAIIASGTDNTEPDMDETSCILS